MIDFIKLHTRDVDVIEIFKQHPDLHWCKGVKETENLNSDKETIRSQRTTRTYRGIAFDFHQNALIIKFLPHYYFNNDRHNANDFTVQQCIDVLRQFVEKFDIDPSTLKVQNIEFGVNVVSPIVVRDLVKWTKYHVKNEFLNHVGLAYSKESYKVGSNGRANGYKIIKAYAKGIQFPEHCHANTFRFEIKSKQAKYIRQQLGVSTFADLLTVEPYERMAETIVKEFDSVLILDHVNEQNNLTAREKTALNKYRNEDTWYKYLNQNRNAYNKHFKKYYALLNKTGSNLHVEVRKIILDKLDTLKRGCIFHTSQHQKEGAYSKIYKGGNCTPPKLCKVTGLDISMQRMNSTMISHCGIKYYMKHEPNVIDELRQSFLSDRWSDADQQTQVRELAHNIRNRCSNQRISERRRYPDGQMNLLSLYLS